MKKVLNTFSGVLESCSVFCKSAHIFFWCARKLFCFLQKRSYVFLVCSKVFLFFTKALMCFAFLGARDFFECRPCFGAGLKRSTIFLFWVLKSFSSADHVLERTESGKVEHFRCNYMKTEHIYLKNFNENVTI